MTKRKRPANPIRILVLLALVAGALYLNFYVVPVTPPLFIPTPTATRAPESYITEARALVNDGKYSQAIESYKLAILSSPKTVSNYVEIALLQMYTADYQGALESVDNAIFINSGYGLAYAIKGWAQGYLGDYLEAEGNLKKAIELDPNSAVPYAYYAEVLVLANDAGQGDLGTMERAAEYSRQAVALDKNSLETHRARGIVLESTANYTEAAAEFEAAIAINPNIADLHLALGRNYRSMGVDDKAVQEFNRANTLNPRDPMPDILLSRTYAQVGEWAKAIQYAQQALKDAPADPYMYGNLGVMYYRKKDYPNASMQLSLAIRGGTAEDGSVVEGLALDYGRIAEYYYVYGLALARQGQCADVLEISTALQQGVPDDSIAVDNAQAMIDICKQTIEAASQPTEENDVTPTP